MCGNIVPTAALRAFSELFSDGRSGGISVFAAGLFLFNALHFVSAGGLVISLCAFHSACEFLRRCDRKNDVGTQEYGRWRMETTG